MRTQLQAINPMLIWESLGRREPMSIDQTDRQILHLLRQDGRRGFADIARLVGVSEPTVRKRVDRLTETGAVFITAQVQPTAVGRPLFASIAVSASPGQVEEVGRRLAALDEVSYLSYVAGSHDILLDACLTDTNDLVQLLHGQIGSIDGVTRIDTSQLLAREKEEYMWEGENVDREPLESLGNGSAPPDTQVSRQFHPAHEEAIITPQDEREADHQQEQVSLDDLDQSIIQMLRYNGRTRYADIARAQGVIQQTIRLRVERLLKHEAILVTARVNPAAFGFPVTVIVRIRVKRGAIRQVGAKLKAMQYVSDLFYVTGSFDIVLEAHLAGSERLMAFLHEDLARVRGIEYAETLLHLRAVKHNYMWEGEAFSRID